MLGKNQLSLSSMWPRISYTPLATRCPSGKAYRSVCVRQRRGRTNLERRRVARFRNRFRRPRGSFWMRGTDTGEPIAGSADSRTHTSPRRLSGVFGTSPLCVPPYPVPHTGLMVTLPETGSLIEVPNDVYLTMAPRYLASRLYSVSQVTIRRMRNASSGGALHIRES